MQRIKAPDPATEQLFTELVSEHQTSLLRMCYLILHDSGLAEDAVQETFVKAYIDGDTAVALRVIDNSSPLEIPLAETVFLSGIGMVDGQLHVQLHYVNHRKIILGKGLDTIAYRPDETGIMLRGKDCEYWYDSRYQDEDRLPGGISAIGWGSQTDDTDTPEWAEIIFTADAAELSADLHEFFAEIRETIPIQGSWDAEIPVRLIRHID